MITAKDARDLTKQSETAIKQLLERYDAKIRAAAESGTGSVDLEVDEEVQLAPMLTRMKSEFGYQVQQLHSRGFRINWITA